MKILVVEDNDVLRASVMQALQENSHIVCEVGDGEEAMDRLQEESYDIVLTDMRMPKKSGMEVLKFAKNINDLTVVIVMTAMAIACFISIYPTLAAVAGMVSH